MRVRGFTLVELLVVLVILGLVAAAAVPTAVQAIQERSLVSSAQVLQGSIIGARDAAIRDAAPRGVRLLPDPAFDLPRLATGQVDTSQSIRYTRAIPLETAPDHSAGKLSIVLPSDYPNGFVPPYPCLVVRQTDAIDPTDWAWNVRAGDKLRIGASRTYTVVGPLVVGASDGNSELFINWGAPGARSPFRQTVVGMARPVELDFLFLVNGQDDQGMYNPILKGHNGYVDDGWDGIDNDVNGFVDDLNEWEIEVWESTLAKGITDARYTITRRQFPSNGKTIAFGNGIAIESLQSKLPIDLFTGAVDIMVQPGGEVVLGSLYSSPTAVGLDQAKLTFHLEDRHGESRELTLWKQTGRIESNP